MESGSFVASAVIASNNLSDLADAETSVTNLVWRITRCCDCRGWQVLQWRLALKSTLTPSVKYRFDQSHSSNAGHPIKFSTTDDGTHNGSAAFTTGINSVQWQGRRRLHGHPVNKTTDPVLLLQKPLARALGRMLRHPVAQVAEEPALHRRHDRLLRCSRSSRKHYF